jgi:2-polyprenyl-6-methoxyphenol hydroxylase-like FAD-dependent oxidoreductase
MQVVIVGAGPVGMVCGLILARRGHSVTLVDRDPPPGAAGTWARRSVMQFHHPHYFRPVVCEVLLQCLRDVWDAVVAAGGIPVHAEGWPPQVAALNCRRSTFERAMWSVVESEPRLSLRTGFAERVVTDGDRASGVIIDGAVIDAEVVIIAAGRTAHIADQYHAPAEGGPCGFAYTTRMYRALDGAEPPASPRPLIANYRGYVAGVFPQDHRTLSTLIVRTASDTALAALRRSERFEAAVRQIPLLAAWTEPGRFEPITPVMAGGLLTNTYRGQFDAEGNVAVAGLFFVGDAISTTNPHSGRGVSLGLQQAAQLVSLLDHDKRDYRSVARQFDRWCADNVRPWFDDQVHRDATLLARFHGDDVDVRGHIPSDVICAAVEADPSLQPVVGPYLNMQALPGSLNGVEERVRTLLRRGWRPRSAEGPSREELVEQCAAAPTTRRVSRSSMGGI